jgi:hypothetical protein
VCLLRLQGDKHWRAVFSTLFVLCSVVTHRGNLVANCEPSSPVYHAAPLHTAYIFSHSLTICVVPLLHQKCFGKFDSNLLILCDHCERETHTYCLEPPLAAVPDTDPWYCQSCTAEGVPDREAGEGDEDGEGEYSRIHGV